MEPIVQSGCGLEHWVWPPVPKGQWGQWGWNWLHNLAINYPRDPSIPDARIALNRLINFIRNLPCAECRYHAACYLRNNPPALASSETFQSWVWRFHNAVNIRLGKPFYPFDRYLEDYADEIRLAA